ncbi:hypothetical protein GCM10010964_08360 [Caldovatus sediminis]|uniref:Uncharacterized protein n=1 Tax=Caldovatus sediminis TaxID=2041189 RepID=A0A8J2Z8G8_9PROT|nr:hypothetical protein GCM10010964_08360 [Caldovatus sediminis]
MSGDGASEVISQPAPVFWTQSPTLEARLAIQSMRKVGWRSGAKTPAVGMTARVCGTGRAGNEKARRAVHRRGGVSRRPRGEPDAACDGRSPGAAGGAAAAPGGGGTVRSGWARTLGPIGRSWSRPLVSKSYDQLHILR